MRANVINDRCAHNQMRSTALGALTQGVLSEEVRARCTPRCAVHASKGFVPLRVLPLSLRLHVSRTLRVTPIYKRATARMRARSVRSAWHVRAST